MAKGVFWVVEGNVEIIADGRWQMAELKLEKAPLLQSAICNLQLPNHTPHPKQQTSHPHHRAALFNGSGVITAHAHAEDVPV